MAAFRERSTWIATTLVLSSVAALAAEERLPRRELAPLEQALADAVGRVSHPATVPVLGSLETCRGYRLPGFGALFVIAPRFVPTRLTVRKQTESDLTRADRELAHAIAGMEEKLQAATTEADKQEAANAIASMKERQQNLRQRAQAQQEIEREIQAYEAQVQAMHTEAVHAQEEADQAMQRMMQRLGRTAARAEEGSGRVSSPLTPPWISWIETPAEESRSPEQILSDVREAIVGVLERRGADLDSLEADEVVAAAVDFVRNPAVDGPQPTGRTLLVRAPKRVLDALRAGKLSPEEAHKQFQVAEY